MDSIVQNSIMHGENIWVILKDLSGCGVELLKEIFRDTATVDMLIYMFLSNSLLPR